MKIVHVSPTYSPVLGGAELHMKELSEGLASRGHDVSVLTVNVTNTADLYHGVHGHLADIEVINGVKVVRVEPQGQAIGSCLRRWLQLPGGWRSLRLLFGEDGLELLALQPQSVQLVSRLVRSRADIVMAMNWHWSPAYYAYLAQRLRHFVFVGIPQFHTGEAWCHRGIYRKMLSSCGAAVAATTHEETFMRNHGAGRVEVVGVGVHPRLFDRPDGAMIRARYALGSAPVVGFVGRQGANKGVVQLIEAMRVVWQWNPEVRLVLAGHRSNEHQDAAVGVTIDALSPSEKQRLIRISQFDDRAKAALYDAFDVFALPSTGESFGISYLEAWMCKKPVIGARIGSTQCVIEDGVDGLLADPMDPRDIASKIMELLSDRDKRVQMGLRGYSKTMANHTWDKVIERVEVLYSDLQAAEHSSKRAPLASGGPVKRFPV
jgi:glycosyltransferase involved in cell wall biosynthesis